MKIEALFSKSYTIFFNTIKSVGPFFAILTIGTMILLPNFSNETKVLLLDIYENPNLLEPNRDVITKIITPVVILKYIALILIYMIVDVAIIQYVLNNYNDTSKIIFNTNKILVYLSKIVGVVIILSVLFSFIPNSFFLIIFMYTYIVLFFYKYFIINCNNNIKDSIINSYTLAGNNHLHVITVSVLNICIFFLGHIFIQIIVSIIGISIFIELFLLLILWYFISIFNISFFKQFEAIHNIK